LHTAHLSLPLFETIPERDPHAGEGTLALSEEGTLATVREGVAKVCNLQQWRLSDAATHRVRGHPEKSSGKDRAKLAVGRWFMILGNKNTGTQRVFREDRAACA